MPLLFEYGNWVSINNKNALTQMLKNIWSERIFCDESSEINVDEIDNRFQPFLQFDGDEIKANNFAGFIQNGDELIEIYPKVFRNHFLNPTPEKKGIMLRHIFYWFNYCRKWNFPFNQASLDTLEITEFPELIINLIATQFLETVSNQPLTLYQQLEDTLVTPRGSINFKRYISAGLTHGNFQNIECDYEPFLFDNKVNRLIKHCSRLLMNQTRFSENLLVLQDVIFILDEVEDMNFKSQDADSISLNSFFDSYSFILDSCKLILNQHLYSNNSNDLSQWCLLFPMEYIFEDFLAGFLEKKFSKEWKVEYQKSNMYLSNAPMAFNMQHDIFLTSRTESARKIIIDTKYKLRPEDFKSDKKKGITQSDLYQMVSYAFKRGCTDIVLVYPNLNAQVYSPDYFSIISGYEGQETINVIAMEIPFWSLSNPNELDKLIFHTMQDVLNAILAK